MGKPTEPLQKPATQGSGGGGEGDGFLGTSCQATGEPGREPLRTRHRATAAAAIGRGGKAGSQEKGRRKERRRLIREAATASLIPFRTRLISNAEKTPDLITATSTWRTSKVGNVGLDDARQHRLMTVEKFEKTYFSAAPYLEV